MLFLSIVGIEARAQTDSGKTPVAKDSLLSAPAPVIVKLPEKIIASKKKTIVDTIKAAGRIAKKDSVKPLLLADSPKIYSPVVAKLSTHPSIKHSSIKHPVDSFYLKLLNNPFLKTTRKPVYLILNERVDKSEDEFFYPLSGLLLFLAFIKLTFSKYFKNIFRLFFQPSFRQKQTREQLFQNNLPSLLLNLFFIFSLSAYISFLLQYYQMLSINFWRVFLYSVAALSVLYTGKFIFLKFSGWVFNMEEAAATYIFAVNLINKIMGVILLPFIILIAFSLPEIVKMSITVSSLVILVLILYRYIVSYSPVFKQMQISVLHTLFYVCAFEVAPLLLIYKSLIIFLDKSL